MSDNCCAKGALRETYHRLDEREALIAHLFGIAFGAVAIVSLAMAVTALMRWFVEG
ncbi:hypothetical protein [Paraburkholderia saeva]|uniref:Uncharacterized protein n=1 Tax=Paraburkholderia saeva TaxID=2777537 RepID=A0A9N8S0M4_9BURK|nr:hypothetical protein [Paraburkholderia saeva]CAG4889309.1 hypothetical protein R52603_00924 [Paraburkholderia saeva]CAG4894547.1 hypothetical protein R70241_01810 [Paraburkholderia saeva]CAG4917705.1 hypothetical protein LMG31841_04709 [Paraburkholderia saeva]